MPARTGCCNPPVEPYTTRKYATSDGSTEWTANYFQDAGVGNSSGGEIRRQLIDTDHVYVGGSRVTNDSTYWNLVAFDKTDGSLVWDRDTYNDATGLSAGIPKVGDVIAMSFDGDGNIVVMLDSWEATTTYFIWIAPDGSLVNTESYSAPLGYSGTRTLYSQGFTLDGSGNIHILATDKVDYMFYTMDWASPFSSSPVVNDIPFSSGTAVKLFPTSMIRYGTRDYIGGAAVNTDFGGDAPPTIKWRSGAVVGASQTSAIGAYDEIDVKIMPVNSLTADTITATGTNQAGAAVLTVGKEYTVSGADGAGVRLPGGSAGDKIILKIVGADSNVYKLYPPTSGTLVSLIGLASLEIDDPIPFGGLNSATFNYIVVCRCVDTGEWTYEDLTQVPQQIWNMPFPSGSNIWATDGFYNRISSYQLPYPQKTSFGNNVVKLDSSGNVVDWFECQKNQVIVDGSGNVYSFGACPDTTQLVGTITKRNSSGVYQWGHRHMQCWNITGPCMEIDGSYLYTSGTWSRYDGTYYLPSGPVPRGVDRDFVDDYCVDIFCTGACVFVPTNQDAVTTEYLGADTVRITATQNCQVAIVLRGGSGGGGGSNVSGVGGGGGGQGEKIFYTVLIAEGNFIDIELGAGGAGGAYDVGDSNGQDGEQSRILDMEGDIMAFASPGEGGLADGTGGQGGGTASDGQDGGNPTGADGGDGGGANGSNGIGGIAATSTAATSGGTDDIDNCCGGGGALGIPALPTIGDGVGGNGSPGYAVVTVTTWDWGVNDDGDDNCSTDCTCPTVNADFYNRYGHPYTSTSTLTVRCRRS